MVPVVVDHHHAAALTSHLEAPLGARELGERGGDPGERHLQLDANRHGAEGVQQVVAARDRTVISPSVSRTPSAERLTVQREANGSSRMSSAAMSG